MKKLLMVASTVLLAASVCYADNSNTGTSVLDLTVGNEAAIVVGTTPAFTSVGIFGTYTTSTPFTYYIRTSQTSGTGSITVQFNSDWAGSGGPSITTPPTAGDYLSYVNTVSSPGTIGAAGNITALSSPYSVATFGANATSAISGNPGSVAWSLVNDPKYAQGSYSVTATFTISAT
jgi:hypothetical protein